MVNLKKFTENKSYYNKYEKQNQTKKIGGIAYYNFLTKTSIKSNFQKFGGITYYGFFIPIKPTISIINTHNKRF